MTTVIHDQSSWAKLRVTGSDRTRFLQGMLTHDVAGLVPGAFVKAALLSAKGRVLAVVDVVAEESAYLLLCEPSLGEKVAAILERHAIMDDVALTPVELPLHRVWPAPHVVWSAPPVFTAAAGSPQDAVEARRIEGGLPRYGADVSEAHFPFEANLDRAISTNKGCYIGQEVVARTFARGHLNRKLVGLRLSGEGPAAPLAPVASATRPDAGVVTSSAVSPDFGPIALGYIHRSAWEPGTLVEVAGTREARVVALPFAS